MSSLKYLVVDLQRDAKQRTMLDDPQVRGDFWEFYAQHVHSRVQEGLTKLVLLPHSA